VARYLLPLATNTSLGQIVNARTLETQVSRLLSHPMAEIRELGVKLREAATGPAWNVQAQAAGAFVEKLSMTDHDMAGEASQLFLREVKTAPTLVKYSQPNEYLMKTQAELSQAARELLGRVPIAAAPVVDLVERTESLEVELAATLIYSAGKHSYRQTRDVVAGLPEARVNEIVELGLRHRGRHDEAYRAFHAGAALRFDFLMDIGGFRDMHRHRRCTQIIQPLTTAHGCEIPDSGDMGPGVNLLEEAGVRAEFESATKLQRATRRKQSSRRCIYCPWPRGSGASSRWTLPKRSTSLSCVQRLPGTSVTDALHGRCILPCNGSTRHWRSICV